MLKKIICFILSMTMGLALCACGAEQGEISEESTVAKTARMQESSEQTPEESENTTETESLTSDENHVLVAYFTWSGNTKEMAENIAEQTGGVLLEIEPLTPYPEDYNETGELAKVERDENQRPEIANLPESVDEYDTILIGYPIWWGIAAWPVNGFIEANDFTGKTVIPFCTSSSSGLGESGELLAEMAGTGDWQEGQRFRSGASESDVAAWVESLEK